jgi:hypothetical protein
MRAGWERGSFEYFLAVHSPKGMLRLFNERDQRQFCEEHLYSAGIDHTDFPYWFIRAEDFISKKVEDDERYKDRVRERFGGYDLRCDP